ncbi:MAG: hypothetical protein ACRDTQ_17685 [Micromonosporaceae bacterium]
MADHVASPGLTRHHADLAVIAVYETAAWMRQPLGLLPSGRHRLAIADSRAALDHSHQTLPMTIRIWAQSDAPVIDLEQGGISLANGFVGYQPPALESAPDDGLWLARMISARLDIRRDEHRSSVRLHMPRPSEEWLRSVVR